ncbi:trypsin-like serine protease [Amycolatopsis rhizosphaerae]|uniref:trypsin-like serine protease n=1 Tax=Amycolatopsis rhizosphaerae TaxID=2053003 RepID=UPI001FE8C3AC|nr:trypsin-like serine protease [Amycolatopsis rhizosphaerae]
MKRSSKTRGFGRQFALAVAVTVGAAGAGLYTASNRNQVHAADLPAQAVGAQGQGKSQGEPAGVGEPANPPATLTSAPVQNAVLPFNAKLTSHDIPVEGGGVRTGGCSGALIDDNWIITAGHCFHDLRDNRIGGKPKYHMTVVVGKNKDSDSGGATRQVVDVRQSPLNDLAVAKLDTPITDIVPLTLDDQKAAIGKQLEFAGWGSLSATVIQQTDHLKRGRFAISAIHSSTYEAQPLATRTVENSPCPDDSGSPYFVSGDQVHGVLVAIEDAGPDCPQPGNETLARIDVVADWIHQQLGR